MINMNGHKEIIIKPGMKGLVVGLGKSGLSAVRFLKKLGAQVFVSESMPKKNLHRETLEQLAEMDVAYETGGNTLDFVEVADFVLVSPGVPLTIAQLGHARQIGMPVFGEMALARHYLNTPVVAITGTNGKSTVTSLIGDLCRAAGKKVFVGGNIGTPLTDYLLGPQDADVVVLEVSSYQLDSGLDFRPDVAVLLNISPDHLDRYGSYEEYVSSKFQIFEFQDETSHSVLNLDDPEIMNNERLWGNGRKKFFGSRIENRKGAEIRNGEIFLTGFENSREVYAVAGTLFETQPNTQNAMAGILAARLIGCNSEAIRTGIENFTLLPHRMTLAGEIGGVQFIDDSKATNIGAVQAALAGMKRPVVLIAGGRDKGAEYDSLNEIVAQKVKAMVLVGEAADKMTEAFQKVTVLERACSMEEAVCKSYQLSVPGDVVLLSPACASFDMFTSYSHRGEVFCEAVRTLKIKREKRHEEADHDVECVSILSCD